MDQGLETRLYSHEGTLIMSTEAEAPTPIVTALVVSAVPGNAPGELGLRWRIHGDPVHAVSAAAKFLQLNPSFADAVQGIMEIMMTGRLDGGRGAQCPHHQHPEEPGV